MTSRQVRRAWARAQLLGGRSPRTVADVATATGGIQAQDLAAAALSVRARGGAATRADVEAAVSDGDVAVAWTLRGTRHLHARADVPWMVGLLGPVFNRPGRRAAQLGIDGPVGDRAVAALAEALADGPIDRDQVKGLLAPLGVDPSGQAPVHVIARAAREGVLYVVPGRPERYARLDRGGEGPADPGAELARRHLAAFGPATPDDFRAWSGLGAEAARSAWSALEGELVEVGGEWGWVLADRAEQVRADGRRPVPPRLLGGFDTLLLGRGDRAAVLPPEHARRVNAGGGLIRPTVLVDGQVVGTWAVRARRVEVTPFDGIAADLGREVAAVSAFLHP